MASDWQRWYQHEIDKWQGSATVQTFSDAGYRAFHNLIMAQFQQDDGKLPDSPAQLAKLSRMGVRWSKVADEVMGEFESDGAGRIYNPTQYKTWKAAQDRHLAYMTRKRRRSDEQSIDTPSIDDQPTIDDESMKDLQGIDDAKEKEKEKEKKAKDSGTEPSSEPPFTTLPLVNGDEFPISLEQFQAWEKAFPGVEVENQLQRLRVWLQANPRKGSTSKGILRRAVNWLSTAQDRPPSLAPGKPVLMPQPGYRPQPLRELTPEDSAWEEEFAERRRNRERWFNYVDWLKKPEAWRVKFPWRGPIPVEVA